MTPGDSLPPILVLAFVWAAMTAGMRVAWERGKLKRPYHLDLLAIAGLGVLNVAFFWQVLFDRAMMPAGGGDLASFLYPMYGFASQALRVL